MELTDKDLDILERYFNETLSDQDKQALNQRLQTDSSFRQAFNEYRTTVLVLDVTRERQQKAFLKNIDASMSPVSRPIRTLSSLWLPMAAAILLLITAGVWFFNRDETGVKLKSPVAGYFEVYPSWNETKGGTETKDKKTLAFEAYNAQKYKKASKLFESAFTEQIDSMLLFYKGISELGGGDAATATISLEKVQNSSTVPQQALSFYLGLAAAENGQTEKAILYLKKAVDTEGGFQEAAKKALVVLEAKK